MTSQPLLVPPTGHLAVEAALVEEAVSLFFERPQQVDQPKERIDDKQQEVSFQCDPTVGGVNNITRFITVRANSSGEKTRLSGDRFVLRIYNNGNNTDRVRFEHCVLAALRELQGEESQQGRAKTPTAILSLRGRPFELLSTGAAVCAFDVIPGTLASTTTPYAVGRAAGVLCRQLAAISDQVERMCPCPTAPYWKIWDVHHAIRSRENFHSIVAAHRSDWFGPIVDVMDELVARLDGVVELCISRYASTLPTQLIHGDLHYDNVLVVGSDEGSGVVSGILDFEFSAFDWRCMELAICLSKYLSEHDPLPSCSAFIEGYLAQSTSDEAEPLVNADECDALPALIALRVLSNVVYFVGRAESGEDSIVSLTTRAASYLKRLTWLDSNADALRQLVRASCRRATRNHSA